MNEPTSTTRAAARRSLAPADGPFVIPAGRGWVLTITATGEKPTVAGLKNVCERGARIIGKAVAAGLDLPGFIAFLEAIAESERCSQAAREASTRVAALLGESGAADRGCCTDSVPPTAPSPLTEVSS